MIDRWLRCRRFAPALKPVSSLCSLAALPCSLAALPCSLFCSPVPPLSPFLLPSCSLSLLRPYKFNRQASFSLCWILIKEKSIMTSSTSHHVMFCSFPLALSLHFHLPAITHQCIERVIAYVLISFLLSLFALYISVIRAFLSCYNSHLYLNFNDEEEVFFWWCKNKWSRVSD